MVLKTSVLYDIEQLGQSMLCQCNCFFYPIIFFKISPTVQVEEHMYFLGLCKLCIFKPKHMSICFKKTAITFLFWLKGK
jgi:hypothetical protein